jgi:hypothetical protein
VAGHDAHEAGGAAGRNAAVGVGRVCRLEVAHGGTRVQVVVSPPLPVSS